MDVPTDDKGRLHISQDWKKGVGLEDANMVIPVGKSLQSMPAISVPLEMLY